MHRLCDGDEFNQTIRQPALLGRRHLKFNLPIWRRPVDLFLAPIGGDDFGKAYREIVRSLPIATSTNPDAGIGRGDRARVIKQSCRVTRPKIRMAICDSGKVVVEFLTHESRCTA